MPNTGFKWNPQTGYFENPETGHWYGPQADEADQEVKTAYTYDGGIAGVSKLMENRAKGIDWRTAMRGGSEARQLAETRMRGVSALEPQEDIKKINGVYTNIPRTETIPSNATMRAIGLKQFGITPTTSSLTGQRSFNPETNQWEYLNKDSTFSGRPAIDPYKGKTPTVDTTKEFQQWASEWLTTNQALSTLNNKVSKNLSSFSMEQIKQADADIAGLEQSLRQIEDYMNDNYPEHASDFFGGERAREVKPENEQAIEDTFDETKVIGGITYGRKGTEWYLQ